jgi:primosomal protein N'
MRGHPSQRPRGRSATEALILGSARPCVQSLRRPQTRRHRTRSEGKLHSRFAFCRVKAAHDDGSDRASREPLWLMVEWPEGEPAPR